MRVFGWRCSAAGNRVALARCCAALRCVLVAAACPRQLPRLVAAVAASLLLPGRAFSTCAPRPLVRYHVAGGLCACVCAGQTGADAGLQGKTRACGCQVRRSARACCVVCPRRLPRGCVAQAAGCDVCGSGHKRRSRTNRIRPCVETCRLGVHCGCSLRSPLRRWHFAAWGMPPSGGGMARDHDGNVYEHRGRTGDGRISQGSQANCRRRCLLQSSAVADDLLCHVVWTYRRRVLLAAVGHRVRYGRDCRRSPFAAGSARRSAT